MFNKIEVTINNLHMENIKLKKAKNTRDFGGIKTHDGRVIKSHCFIRSAALDELSRKDIEILKNEYGLKTVIDLRTDTERQERPDIIIDGVKYIHIHIFNEETGGITHEKSQDKKAMLMNLPDLSNLYRVIVSDKDCINQLKKVFEVITTSDNTAILWHCTEGKDRCGIVSALFLSLLDVDPEVIYEDYLYTNNARSKTGDKYYRLVRYLMRDRESAERLRSLFVAKREYLDSAVEEINKQYGSVDEFMQNALGITDEIKTQMKEKYTTKL